MPTPTSRTRGGRKAPPKESTDQDRVTAVETDTEAAVAALECGSTENNPSELVEEQEQAVIQPEVHRMSEEQLADESYGNDLPESLTEMEGQRASRLGNETLVTNELEKLLELQVEKLLNKMYEKGMLAPGPNFGGPAFGGEHQDINSVTRKNKQKEKNQEKEINTSIDVYIDKRNEEVKISDRPILRSLQSEKIAKFLVIFKNYEDLVLKRIIGLEEADITRSLNYKTFLELQMANVDPTSRIEVLNYLKLLNEQSWNAQKHTLLTRASRRLKWKNLSDVNTSMQNYIAQVDSLVLGMDISSDKYLKKAFSLLVLKKLPLTFRGRDAQHTQKLKGWKDYTKMKNELNLLLLLCL
eukprot:augustus_masked-scaffold_8-processed-gene-4.52-mRNA-1 protein AED:1.00 eAED:1.00 QI:0/-1/0/0/-1/1/1/0/354